MRIALVLLVALALNAIGLVSSQYQARRLVTQLETEQARAKQLDVEFGQLQLEQSTWAMHSRVERVASEKLRMRMTDSRRTTLVPEPPREPGR